MQSSYQIRLTKLKTREEWRHVSSKSIENSKLHLDAIQATMMILFNVKVFSSTLQTSSLRLEWQQFGVCQIFQVHLMTSFTSGMVKSQKLRFHTPLSWPKSNKSKKSKSQKNLRIFNLTDFHRTWLQPFRAFTASLRKTSGTCLAWAPHVALPSYPGKIRQDQTRYKMPKCLEIHKFGWKASSFNRTVRTVIEDLKAIDQVHRLPRNRS